jgi:membrane protein implicated in regulation of membrane protease activity
MDLWVWWTIAGVAFAVGEMAIMGFALAPFAGGSFVAALFALAGAGTAVSIVVFAVITTLLFLFVRPVARRHVRQPPETRTGTAALIGRSGMVLERIANDEGVGCVRLDGEVWSARSYDDDETFEPGTRVHVMEIRGATALVADE